MKTLLALLLMSAACLAERIEYQVVPKPGKFDEFISIKTPNGLELKNARIVKANALEVRVMHDDGIATLETDGFPYEIRQAFGAHNPEARNKAEEEIAERERLKRAEAKARLAAIKAENEQAAGQAKKDEKKTVSVSMEMNSPKAKEIKARAAEKWPHNFPMQEYETKKQAEAYLKLQLLLKIGVHGMPAKESDIVIAEAMEEWKDNYEMVMYEINEQAKAYKALNR
ncbi:MAG: hypothetical protein WAW39_15975 [Prosthecobacter sp.]|uniref:hypothetical protein n=1 Tax=Prosthecobacter sp. TaxID=1965333 RepID=UPI003BB1A598